MWNEENKSFQLSEPIDLKFYKRQADKKYI